MVTVLSSLSQEMLFASFTTIQGPSFAWQRWLPGRRVGEGQGAGVAVELEGGVGRRHGSVFTAMCRQYGLHLTNDQTESFRGEAVALVLHKHVEARTDEGMTSPSILGLQSQMGEPEPHSYLVSTSWRGRRPQPLQEGWGLPSVSRSCSING